MADNNNKHPVLTKLIAELNGDADKETGGFALAHDDYYRQHMRAQREVDRCLLAEREIRALQTIWGKQTNNAPEPSHLFRQTSRDTHKPEWWLDIEVDTESEAIAVLNKLSPEPLYIVRDNWLSFVPECRLDVHRYPKFNPSLNTKTRRQRKYYHQIQPWRYEVNFTPVDYNNGDGTHYLTTWKQFDLSDVSISDPLAEPLLCRLRIRIANPTRNRGLKWDEFFDGDSGRRVVKNVRTFDHSGLSNQHYSPLRSSDNDYPKAFFFRTM